VIVGRGVEGPEKTGALIPQDRAIVAGPPWRPSGCASFVLMMQPAEMGLDHDVAHDGP
jgi:hypothetical protein